VSAKLLTKHAERLLGAGILALAIGFIVSMPRDGTGSNAALGPVGARAICNPDPRATGWLTTNGSYNSNGSGPAHAGDINSATVYAYISNLEGTNDGGSSGDKDCGNPVYRYGGVLWLTNTTTASINWGAFTANGNSSNCYLIYGTNDYMHANWGTTCAWAAGGNPGINYRVLSISLSPANISYDNDIALNGTGDFEFVWDSCSTFYQSSANTGKVTKTGVPKSDLDNIVGDTTAISWKPGANCGGALTQDGTGTSQTFVYDTSPPTMTGGSVTASGANTYQMGNTVYVKSSGSGSVALLPLGFDNAISPASNNSQVKDYLFGATAGTTAGWSPTTAVTQAGARTYSWTSSVADGQQATVDVKVNDQAGNQSATLITTTLVGDDAPPAITFSAPPVGPTYQTSTSYTVTWSESELGSGIASRSLQRQIASSSAGPFNNDTAAGNLYTGASPSAQTLQEGKCYQWIETAPDRVGNVTAVTSGVICVDSTQPSASLMSPATGGAERSVVDVVGTATDLTTFRDWTLEQGAGPSPSTWTTVATGTNQVTGAFVADWDTRSLSGVYTLRLTVRDWSGNTAQAASTVLLENSERGVEPYRTDVPFDLGGGWGLAIATDTGEARLARDLFSIPSYGPAQALSLRYNSRETNAAAKFGVGWSSNLTQYLTFEGSYVVWHRADSARIPFGQVGGVWTALRGHYETLSRGASEDTVTLVDQTRLVFENSGAGRLKRVENRFGKALTLVWNTSSATATDASGRFTNLTIDPANNRITAVTDSAGRTWTFGYATGSTNDLTSVTDSAGKATTLAYDASHQLTTVTRTRTPASGPAETITWSIAYTSGKATSVTDPVNQTVANTFTYNATNTVVGLLKTYSPVVRNTTTYALNYIGGGWTATTTDPEGFVTTRTFDAESRLASINRPAGPGPVYQLVTYTYDRGNVASETTQLDGVGTVVTTRSWYSAANDLLIRSEADNDSTLKLVTKYTYDGFGHRISVNVNCTTTGTAPPTDASTCTGAGTQDAATNLITASTYTSSDQLLDETDPLGHVTHHGYDSFGDETSVTQNYVSGQSALSDRNVVSAAAYDQATTAGRAGLVTSATDPLGRVTSYTYDVMGRGLTESLPGDASIPALSRTTTYDEFGNPLTETESWIGVTRTTTHVYDQVNRGTSVTDPAGVVSTTSFDAAGDATSSTSGGVTTTRTFDGLGRVVTETVGTAVTSHTYDPAGNETRTVDPVGVTTDRTFDLASRQLTDVVSGETTSSSYDRLGRLTSVSDPAGGVTTYTYDRPGRTTQTNASGAVSSSAFDRADNLLSTKNPTGDVNATAVDALDREVQSITNCTNSGTTQPSAGVVCTGAGTHDASTNLTTTTYLDAVGNTLATKDPVGVVNRSFLNVRDLASKTIANCTDSGTSPPANPAACTGAGTADARTNVVTDATFDGAGATLQTVVTVANGPNITTQTAYDAANRAVASRDPQGTISRTFYDVAGRVSSVVLNCTNTGTSVPTSGWESCAATGTHDATWNVTTSFTYDSHGNKLTETAANGRVTRFIYDAADRLAEQTENYVASPTQPDQNLTTYFAYDDAGRKVAVRTPTVDRTTFAVAAYIYDAQGRLASEIRNCTVTGTTPPGDPAWRTCGGQGTKNAATNLITSYAYDVRGNRTAVTVPNPADTAAAVTYVTTYTAYDAANRRCRVLEVGSVDLQTLADPCTTPVSGTSTSNLSTRYTYDPAGNLASMIDARGNTTAYAYDASGRMVSLTDALTRSLTWTYDALGRRTGQTNRTAGQSVTWTYDGAGRLISRAATGVATVTYTYDAASNRLTASDGTRTITSTYDRLNRPLTVSVSDDAGAATSYTYSFTSPGWSDASGSYGVGVDAFGRETSLFDPIHGSTSWASTYRADGQSATLAAPNGNTTAFSYDAAGRPTGSATTAAGPVTRASYTYSLNRAGQRLAETSTITGDPTNGTVTFTFDAAGRLSGYSGTPVTSQTYAWDKVPNRTSKQVGGGPAITITYDAANRPTSDSAGGTYTSDFDGRLTALPGGQLVWDSLGRLTQVKDPVTHAAISTYTYDPLDRLATVANGIGLTKFRYVGGTSQVAEALDLFDGVRYSVVTSFAGEARMDFGPIGERYYGTNGHRDLTWTAGASGTVTATLRSDPWGTPGTTTGGSLPEFRFQGSWFDTSSAVSWVVTRWYSPGLGRFVSEDTLLGRLDHPASRNLYAYAEGDPVNAWDPDGQMTWGDWFQWFTRAHNVVLAAVYFQLWILSLIFGGQVFVALPGQGLSIPGGGPNGGFGHPDLAWKWHGLTFLWEVKHESVRGRSVARAQLARYVLALWRIGQFALPGFPMARGSLGIPGTSTRVSWYFGKGLDAGIVFYRTTMMPTRPVPVPVPVPAPQPVPAVDGGRVAIAVGGGVTVVGVGTLLWWLLKPACVVTAPVPPVAVACAIAL